MRSTPRLYIEADLAENALITLPEGQSHYILRVMRLTAGSKVSVFNGRDGEWICAIADISRKAVQLTALEQTRQNVSGSDLWLVFAPLKVKARTSFIVEKAVELGAGQLSPVLTQRTQIDRVKIDKWQATAIEAAEQTERLDVPNITEPTKLSALLERWDKSRQLIFADEAGDDASRAWGGTAGRGRPMVDVLREYGLEKAAILTGPEGGFSRDERALLRSLDFVMPVTLGPRILRGETASVAALTIWQSIVGDWR